MTLVIKLGGQAVEEMDRRRALAQQIAKLQRSGHRVVVVHGGGKLLTQTLGRLNIPTRFVEGLRVTDRATRDVALMVLAGLINKQWVAEIAAQGAAAVGIAGGDGALIRARKIQAKVNGREESLGFVGRPQKVNKQVLEVLLAAGMIPVVASLALGPDDEYLNVNADDFAAALATALAADRLFYFTESGGVWDAERRVLPEVRLSEIPKLIAKGVVREGMVPKLRSCARTLRQSVGEIDIVSPDVPNVLVETVRGGSHGGTRIVNDTRKRAGRAA